METMRNHHEMNGTYWISSEFDSENLGSLMCLSSEGASIWTSLGRSREQLERRHAAHAEGGIGASAARGNAWAAGA